ncbi:hypothetical protein [Vibrio natriegens]|uniref:hypothetical protein n=1 Tax=Vibrio natriegens TaxID=691 RepID=UPI003B5CEF82
MGNFLETFNKIKAEIEGHSFSPNYKTNGIEISNGVMYVRPSEIELEEFISPADSESLTIFTYTIGSSFSEVVKKNVSQCNGHVSIVFKFVDGIGYEQKLGVCRHLIKLSKNTKSLSIYISNNSHVKFFQRDDYAVVGSQNFSKGADSHPKDELIVEFESGGKKIAERLLSYFGNMNSTFRPIGVKGKDAKCLLREVSSLMEEQLQDRRDLFTNIKDQVIDHLKTYFELETDDVSVESILRQECYIPDKLNYADDFFSSLNRKYHTKFDFNDLSCVAVNIMEKCIGKHANSLSEYIFYDSVDDIAMKRAKENLDSNRTCYESDEGEIIEMGNGNALAKATDEEVKKIKCNNEGIVRNFVDSVNKDFKLELNSLV